MSCNCGYTLPITTIGKKSAKNLCICFKDFVSLCSEGIEPCGGTFTLDLSDRIYNEIGTSETVTVYSKSPAFETANIVNGELVVTTSSDAVVGRSYEVVLELTTEVDGQVYGTFGTVKLCVKDLCKNKECLENQYCDECTGNCEDSFADVGGA